MTRRWHPTAQFRHPTYLGVYLSLFDQPSISETARPLTQDATVVAR
jgi:hypothetical protein